jgi:acetolactate synthase-1/3 small subunit
MQNQQKHSLYTQKKAHELKTEHILVALLEDKAGVFSRIAGLFRRRRFNIKNMTVGNTGEKGFSHMTLVVDGTKTETSQVIKQLYKIIEVIDVQDLTLNKKVVRELALVKLEVAKSTKNKIIKIIDDFKAQIIDDMGKNMIIEITGDALKIESFLEALHKFGIKELVRTGVTAMRI